MVRGAGESSQYRRQLRRRAGSGAQGYCRDPSSPIESPGLDATISDALAGRSGPLTSSSGRDSRASQDDNPFHGAALDILSDSGETPVGERLGRAIVEGRFLLSHSASKPTRDAGSWLISVAASSTYFGGVSTEGEAGGIRRFRGDGA